MKLDTESETDLNIEVLSAVSSSSNQGDFKKATYLKFFDKYIL